ncbi:uncharacterized protein J3D65DRAFT_143632 [Phyllosticta citribraziliensis]|uniref:Uncharacterized protein n=1 Tax=Phyllosticta citribraziliensis TaxID=989973 RepID=A0ABR1LAU7_9PEZI
MAAAAGWTGADQTERAPVGSAVLVTGVVGFPTRPEPVHLDRSSAVVVEVEYLVMGSDVSLCPFACARLLGRDAILCASRWVSQELRFHGFSCCDERLLPRRNHGSKPSLLTWICSSARTLVSVDAMWSCRICRFSQVFFGPLHLKLLNLLLSPSLPTTPVVTVSRNGYALLLVWFSGWT